MEEELQLKDTENIFNKIIKENFPNLKKDIPMKVQEAYRTPTRLDRKVALPYNNKKPKYTRIKKEY